MFAQKDHHAHVGKETAGELVRYVVVGGLTTVVSLGTYYLCVATFLDAEDAVQLQVANVISWICAVAFAYVTNRKFVFRSKSESVFRESALFVGSRVTTLLMDMAVMFVGVTLLHGNDAIVKLVSQVVVTVGNYVLSKLVVFRKH